MKLYSIDFGRSVSYPSASGQGFLVKLYLEGVLTENSVYLCPSTPDDNMNVDLTTIPEFGNGFEPVSYTGRKNKDKSKYPGLFIVKDAPLTTISSDDWNDGEVENHENGDLIIFLFLDGHSDHIISRSANFTNYSFNYNPLAN